MKRKDRIWVILFFALVGSMLMGIGILTCKIDPFFHYHKPDTDHYFYPLYNQRSQNDGISRNFEYDGLITGTSMTENFKTSDAERFLGGRFIKVPYSGGTYKELNDNLRVALSHNPHLKRIVRGLEMYMFTDDKDRMREDLGGYPTYLYDNNIFNDVEYIFNRDVVFSRVYTMLKKDGSQAPQTGITSFDDYSNWMANFTFGINTLYPDGVSVKDPVQSVELTEEEKQRTRDNIRQNVTDLADEYPDVTFYYFFPPYSIQWWQSLVEAGTLDRQIELEKLVIEEILPHKNIKLFSFNGMTDMITDLNNYKDMTHYGEWINSLILKYISEDNHLLTKKNYKGYLSGERKFYSNYDFAQLEGQKDYAHDNYAAALWCKEIYGTSPKKVDLTREKELSLLNALVVANQHKGNVGIQCKGRLKRPSGEDKPLAGYLMDEEYVGFKYVIKDMSPYNYLVFYGRKEEDHGQPSVVVYDEEGKVLKELNKSYQDLDNNWHQFIIDLSDVQGKATIIFNGGYTDDSGNKDSRYVFSDMTLY